MPTTVSCNLNVCLRGGPLVSTVSASNLEYRIVSFAINTTSEAFLEVFVYTSTLYTPESP